MRTTKHASGARAVARAGLSVLMFASASPATAQDAALAPGLGIGGTVGINGFGGEANREIGSGVGWEVYLSAATRAGFYVRGGLSLSAHGLEGDSSPWQFRSFFLEPRWFAVGLSSRIAPFVAARAGLASERVPGRTWELKASGVALGAGGGVSVRVADQISIEAGVLVGRTNFDAYEFVGEFAWKDCLDGLETGTPLPASVAQCSGSRSIGGVVQNCYPPYFPERTSNCDPPEIPYDGTGRTGNWLRTWVGVSLALTSR